MQRVAKLFEQEILANKEEIVNLVRNRWKRGKRPDGGIIGTYRDFGYEQEKRQRNPLAQGRVDLIDQGDLERGLTLNKVSQGIFNIFSTDEKAADIAKKYGLDVYGLSKKELLDVLNFTGQRVHIKIAKFIEL